MTFANTLNEFCTFLGCTNKELAERCGISASAISRYRKGERTPERSSNQIDKLAKGLAELYSQRKFGVKPTEDEIRQALLHNLDEERERGLRLCGKADELMSLLGIRNSEMAKHLRIDPSYLSRIRSKQRIPADLNAFARKFAQFASRRCVAKGMQKEIAKLVGLEEVGPPLVKLTRSISRWMLE